ncbi:acetylcholinesterase [Sclerotinia borealis F-4128]|uniref:Acetylcholinesterase n=1 Tax=Sclerotinia borealis (strain F-4128) TaxID=1432307 RepID=W9CIZ7_SCLBF|nr:acetylcholinesterase [Sclerotinia borealis F-4128]
MGNTISYRIADHQLDLGDGNGSIKGLQYDSKASRYAGVPYISHDGGPFDATRFGPICSQDLHYTSSKKDRLPEEAYGEDCLRLNIWTPVNSDENKKWLVMLWLYGGWFQMGDPSHEAGMDPTELISSGKLNAIVVAIE